MKSTVYDLYRGHLSVWVEDDVTHEFLTTVWADKQINVIAGCGQPSVGIMVAATPPHLHKKVFGVVDRDIGTDNREDWRSPSVRVLKLPVHEIENLLLDFDILAELAREGSVEDIKRRAEHRARDLLFWLTCKAILRRIRNDLQGSFPSDPDVGRMTDIDAVKTFVLNCDFWQRSPATIAQWSPAAVRAEIERLAVQFERDLESGDWISTFPGKEILRYLRSHVQGLEGPRSYASERDLDLAKRIARRMHTLRCVPPILTELHETLRCKAGLDP